MDGSGFSLSIEAISGKNGSAQALYEELYSVIEVNPRRLAKGKGYRQMTEEYLEAASADGAGEAGAIGFGFGDGAGPCEASAHACDGCSFRCSRARPKGAHSPAIALLAASLGFRITEKVVSMTSLLDRCKAPLVLVRGHLCGAGTLGHEVFLVSDELEGGAPRMDDLTSNERDSVETAVLNERCECRICAGLRDPAFAPKLPKKARPTPRNGPRRARPSHTTLRQRRGQ
jgi:hypothetical protein